MTEIRGFRSAAAASIDITGKDRVPFLQGQSTNDIVKLPEGETLRAASLNPKGHLLAEFRVKKMADRLRILTRPARHEALLAHFRKYAVFQEVSFEERAAGWRRIDFIGTAPAAPPGLHPDVWPPFFEWTATWLAGPEDADSVLGSVSRELRELTEEEAEATRIEAGRPLWGVDMDESNLPDEVGMDDAISTTKGCYVGQEIVARLRTYGRVTRRLAGLAFENGFVAPRRSVLVSPSSPETICGEVTSAALSEKFGAIGLGYVRREVEEGEIVELRDHPGRRARIGPKSRR